jgi:hypothetical protein
VQLTFLPDVKDSFMIAPPSTLVSMCRHFLDQVDR